MNVTISFSMDTSAFSDFTNEAQLDQIFKKATDIILANNSENVSPIRDLYGNKIGIVTKSGRIEKETYDEEN